MGMSESAAGGQQMSNFRYLVNVVGNSAFRLTQTHDGERAGKKSELCERTLTNI